MSVILWTFLATFHDIFITQTVQKFPRNFSRKVLLFFRKFLEKFGNFPTYNPTCMY